MPHTRVSTRSAAAETNEPWFLTFSRTGGRTAIQEQSYHHRRRATKGQSLFKGGTCSVSPFRSQLLKKRGRRTGRRKDSEEETVCCTGGNKRWVWTAVSKESSQKCGERGKRDQDDRIMWRWLDFIKNQPKNFEKTAVGNFKDHGPQYRDMYSPGRDKVKRGS